MQIEKWHNYTSERVGKRRIIIQQQNFLTHSFQLMKSTIAEKEKSDLKHSHHLWFYEMKD